MNFEVTVIEFPATHLVGVKVRTNMQKAQADCPAIWQTFGPRIVEIPCGDCIGKGAYGVSVMLNENDFDYWAAVEAAPETALPNDMASFDLPGGLYAKCSVTSLEKLGEAYMYIYGPWISGQSEYELNMQAPCFELYPQNWRLDTAFEVYVPVTKK